MYRSWALFTIMTSCLRFVPLVGDQTAVLTGGWGTPTAAEKKSSNIIGSCLTNHGTVTSFPAMTF